MLQTTRLLYSAVKCRGLIEAVQDAIRQIVDNAYSAVKCRGLIEAIPPWWKPLGRPPSIPR